jgi:glycosyltransferase involved in cell wall biosynthesis
MGIEVRAEIAGSGPSESALRDLVGSLGVAERVRFLGWQVDVDRLLASWDLLVIPSLEEGFPLSALEAMAAARPVVASRVGGLSELVVDGVTGRLVPPGDTEALVRCIAEMASDRRRLSLMGDEGWKRVRGHFSAELMARRTVELYDRLLHRGKHRTAWRYDRAIK